jgi:hypothetical protein
MEGVKSREDDQLRIQMEPTEHIITIDGVECRVWNAITDRDTQCFIFVHRIAVPDGRHVDPEDWKDLQQLFEGWTPKIIRIKNESPI